MMSRLIRSFAFLAVVLLAPNLAQAEVLACDLLGKADVEAVTGISVAAAQARALNTCSGICESIDGSECLFKDRNGTSVSLDLYLPPFAPGDALARSRAVSKSDRQAQIADVTDLGAPAFWSFRRDRAYGLLHVVDRNRVHFVIRQQGIIRSEVALGNARALAALVLTRFRAK
jgi:hypothetical protein